jgi:membrane fusion protein (multidrug efflux system)
MKKKNIIRIITIIILAFSIFLILTQFKQNDKKSVTKRNIPKKVDAFILKPSLLIEEISINGFLQAFDEIELKNEVSGRIVKINLPEGKFVKKGTLLVKIFDDDLQANLKKLQAQLAVQERIYKRQSELLKVSGISQNEYDQTLLQLNTFKADIEIQKTLIRKTEVLAPFDGTIGLRNISEGAVVTPSTLMATIRTENKLKLDFYIPERYGSQIKTGQKVNFNLSNSDKLYEATVMATEQGIDNNTRNLKVRALVNNPAKELISGAFTTVKLILSENQNALLIPTQAIIPQESDKTVIVARNGKAHFAKVKTGIRQTDKIEIISGLQAGDTIITTGLLFLKENAKLLYSTISE